MKLTLTTFLTLDGVMQAPGGPEEDTRGEFPYGGWMFPFPDQVFGAQMSAWFVGAEAFLLGRRTYETFAAHWPKVPAEENPVAAALNSKTKYVVTRGGIDTSWSGTEVIDGDVFARVAELKEGPGGELQVHGSGELARGLLAAGLLDELRLLIHPVVLGRGRRLFEEGTPPRALRLLESRPTSTGVTIAVYEPQGEPSFGSFAER